MALFTQIPYALQTLINNIDSGILALPEIQRPFVEVSQVFARVNSAGKRLNLAGFILTLMSVHWDKGRHELEAFARKTRQPPAASEKMPFNFQFRPDPDHLLRVGVALAFRRARLQSVYAVLRGKDMETEIFSPERRDEQFSRLKDAQRKVLDLANWFDFLTCLTQAGFIWIVGIIMAP